MCVSSGSLVILNLFIAVSLEGFVDLQKSVEPDTIWPEQIGEDQVVVCQQAMRQSRRILFISKKGRCKAGKEKEEEKEREREDAELREMGHAQTQGLGTVMQLLAGRALFPDRRMYRYVIHVVLRSLPEPLRAAASRQSAGALSVAGLRSGARLRLHRGDKDG